MKLLFASDIHGDARACAAVLARAEAEGAERIILLGDLLYHGPRNPLPPGFGPKETAALLNENAEKLLCVRGNCDAEVDQMVLSFPVLATYAWLSVDGHTVYATHGHHNGHDDPPPLCRGEILLHGHTHLPALERREGYVYLNPGSVSLPKGGNPPTYMMWEDGTVSLCGMDGTRIETLVL